MARVQNRFTELLEAKRRRERKSWTYREIQDETGINPATLTRFAKQRHNQYDSETLAQLCVFLGVPVGDFLVVVDESGHEIDLGQGVAVAAT